MSDRETSFSAGLVSTVLGTIGLALFFLPILGGPLSTAGLAVGLGAVVAARLGRPVDLRWAVAGVLLGATALGTNLAMYFGPIDLVPPYPVAPMWQPVNDRPYVPPPASLRDE